MPTHSLLITSILNVETEIVRLLLEQGADPNVSGQIKKNFDQPPLEIAIEYSGNPEIISLLIEHGANPYYRDGSGFFLLQMAVLEHFPMRLRPPAPQEDRGAVIRLFLELNFSQYGDKTTALHWVQNAAVIPLLCAYGAEINAQDYNGQTPLHRYAEGSHDVEKVIQERLNRVRLILARNPDILHHRNNQGETLLITSILNGETEIVRLLLQSGADANETAQIKAGQFADPPLAIAIRYNGDPEIVSLLLMHGADPTYRDGAGRTLLMLAGGGYTPVDTWNPNPKADPEANFRRMLDLTPDVNQRDHNGDTALHWVYYAAFIPLLCARGAEINVHGREGKTPLHQYLDMNGSREVIALVETLLRFGPDVNARDENGETPLHYIAFYDEWASAPDIVRLLLAAGADPNIQNRWGNTALHLAVESIHGDVITQLLKAGAHLNLRDQEGRTPLKMLEGDKSRYSTRDGLDEEEIEALLLQAGAHL